MHLARKKNIKFFGYGYGIHVNRMVEPFVGVTTFSMEWFHWLWIGEDEHEEGL